jgi:ferredoxin
VKVKIDAELCTGHGRCSAVAQQVYKLDDNGYNADRGKSVDVPAGLEAPARLGSKRCPERAITIIDE